MAIHTIDQLEVEGKRVFLRADLNVPLENGEITDDMRLQAMLPTVQALLDRGARLIIASHLGRPKGQPAKKYSLEPVGAYLSEALGRPIYFACDTIGAGPRKLAQQLRNGEILLLENLRFVPGEKANDDGFSRQLAQLADVYVNDAFGTAHRKHASVVGMVEHFKHKAAGYLLKRELRVLEQLLNDAQRPFTLVLGGAKVADKIPVLDNLLGRVDTVLIGGAMAYTFLRAQGHDVGSSRVEEKSIGLAKRILDKATRLGVGLHLPVDHIVAQEMSANVPTKTIETDQFTEGWMGFDIGPATRELYASQLKLASTICWNGPMGVFEIAAFAQGTMRVTVEIAKNPGLTVIGGGDSMAAVNSTGLADQMSHVSTGGGASLEYLSGKPLPAVEALAITDREIDIRDLI